MVKDHQVPISPQKNSIKKVGVFTSYENTHLQVSKNGDPSPP